MQFAQVHLVQYNIATLLVSYPPVPQKSPNPLTYFDPSTPVSTPQYSCTLPDMLKLRASAKILAETGLNCVTRTLSAILPFIFVAKILASVLEDQ